MNLLTSISLRSEYCQSGDCRCHAPRGRGIGPRALSSRGQIAESRYGRPGRQVNALDAALTKTLEGATELERVLAAGPVVQTPANESADLNQPAQ
ncbi:hypothetical protein [Gluconobacter cerinus]|uniref:hypothetical protein n=1 Tax=Gluconobacter cerinus TaxID=38307 RepID=UPI001C051B23|nr:hypothetical protein [Gluconobacter cerinus]